MANPLVLQLKVSILGRFLDAGYAQVALCHQHRAVPEIVDYTNQTCYDHEIIAWRRSSLKM